MRIPILEPKGGHAAWIRLMRSPGRRGVRDGTGGEVRSADAGRAGRKTLAVLGTLLAFSLIPASAQALQVHTFSFGSAGTGAGQFESPQGVAINQSTGDVYVVDAGNFRVDKFTPNLSTQSGGFDLAFGANVGGSGVNVCTTTCSAGTQGTSAGAFQAPQFVAVDNSGGPSQGDVYVGDPGDDTISKFDANGNLVTTWATGGQLSGAGTFSSIDGITVDGGGNLLVINGSNSLFEFAQGGAAVTNFGTTRGMSPNGLDVTPDFSTSGNTGSLYKVNGDGSTERFTPSTGAFVTIAGDSSPSLSTTELTVDRATGDLYVDTGSFVAHYVFNSSGQVVQSGGTCTPVDGGGCQPTDSFGTGILGSGTGVGFDHSQTAAYVADAGNNDVAVFGPPSPGPPVIDGEFASGVGSTYASINALINPFDNATTCQFEWGTTTAYGNTVPCPATLAASFSDTTATVALTGLTINTTYHFRVDATNSAGGPVDGADQTFTTLGPATIDSQSATNIGSTSATLNAQVNPLGTDTTCTFNYILDSTFVSNGGNFTGATSVPCSPADLGAGKADVAASAAISAGTLTPNTLYDFQVVATNSLGTVSGAATQFTTAPPLSIDSESATNIGAEAATLNTQINPNGTDTTCQFQYVDDTTFKASGYTNATTVTCNPADLGAGTSDVSATANVTGLTPNTVYHFRAVGTNSLAPSGFPGSDTTFTTAPPGVIDAEFANNITQTGATLNAKINPEGLDTTCTFQYVDDATFKASGYANATTATCTPADLGSGIGDVSASAAVTGLSANTLYHFRVVAANSAGTLTGTDDTFRTGGAQSTGLPDGRAYEMVSPPNTNGGEVGTGGSFSLSLGTDDEATPDGNKIVYFSLSPFGNAQSGGLIQFYLASRGPTGWTTNGLVPPQAPSNTLNAPNYQAYSTDLSVGALIDGGGGEFAQDSPPLVPGEPANHANLFLVDTGTGAAQLANVTPASDTPADANFDGASADMSTIVFDEPAQLTPNAPPGQDNLYRYDTPTRTVSLIGGGAHLGSNGRVLNAVSADGSVIFYSTSSGNLNMLQIGSPPVQIDKPQGGLGSGGGGQFMTASTDGSEVFFTDGDSAGLTSDTVTGSGTNLYRYDASLGTLTDLTGGNSNVNVDGVIGASADGSFVYFVANGALANSGAPASAAGQPNLYVNQQGTTTFIATLNGNDSSDWGGTNGLTARITPDGTHLAFDSVNNLTGYNNTDANTGSPDSEVFLYEFGPGQLVCASCNPTGAQPTGPSEIESAATSSVYLSRNLSDDGSRLFFDSSDSLLPAATNGKKNVYEWENGQVHLISTGTARTDDGFFDASASGNDVFFRTRPFGQSVFQSGDTHYALFDARVGGGFPAAPPPPAPCLGDACKPAATPAPAVPLVATISFVGPGNPTPPAAPNTAPGVAPKVTVTAKTVVLKHGKFAFAVRVPGKGKIKISGSGLKTANKAVGQAGTFKVTVGLTSKELSKLKKAHNGKLTIMTHVTFTSASGASSTATVPVTVKK